VRACVRACVRMQTDFLTGQGSIKITSCQQYRVTALCDPLNYYGNIMKTV